MFSFVLLVFLLGLIFADEETIDKYPYSSFICKSLYKTSVEYSTRCSQGLKEMESSYSDNKEVFFTDEEIKKFLKPFNVTKDDIREKFKIGYDYTRKELEDMRYTADHLMPSEVEDAIDHMISIFELGTDLTVDITLSIIIMINKFTLGGVSLANYPIGFFELKEEEYLPVVTDSIIKQFDEDWEETKKMVDKYLEKCNSHLKSMCNILNISDNYFINELGKFLDSLDDLYNFYLQNLTLISEDTFNFMISTMQNKYKQLFCDELIMYTQCILIYDTDCINLQTEAGRSITMLTHLFTNITPNTLIIRNEGFDMLSAALKTPDYDTMVTDIKPDGVKSGMEWWIITLIAASGVIVLAAIGFCVYYFIVRPRMSKNSFNTRGNMFE